MKWYHRLFRPLFNWVGALNGNSGCLICGDSWYWKEPHVVNITKYEGAFPVCEECWQTAKTEEIVRAAKSLGAIHLARSCPLQLPASRRKASLMIAAVEKAAKKRCNFCPVGPQRDGILPAACVGCRMEEIKLKTIGVYTPTLLSVGCRMEEIKQEGSS